MAKSYLVLVEAEGYITVEAENEQEAEAEAVRIAQTNLNADWKATVMHEEEIDG